VSDILINVIVYDNNTNTHLINLYHNTLKILIYSSVVTGTMKKALVTGGAGFIGSAIVEALMFSKTKVTVFDIFSSGVLTNVNRWLHSHHFTLLRGDLLHASDLSKLEAESFDLVFHLAANPEVRVGSINPGMHFQQNLVATHNLLEYIRKTQKTPTLVFTSTSTVYGEPTTIPTPENYSPLAPISIYGATKLACEALISGYAHTYGLKAIIYRLANIIGPRSTHGVIRDFIQKLEKNRHELEILGDGTQNKSYLHISDCTEAIILGMEKSKHKLDVYNVGSEDQISVKEIARIIIKEMGLRNVKLTFSGGVDGGRGWRGDVKNMLLDITKIKSLGWKPKQNSKQAVERTAKELVNTTRA